MGRKPGVRPEPDQVSYHDTGTQAAAATSATAAAPWDEAVRAHPKLGGELIHTLHLDAVPERSAAVEPPLPEALAAAVARSIGRLHRAGEPLTLWAHQAEALAAARGGEDVLVTTPTASGKSLVFQLPVLEEAMAGRPGRALFLFPLKALGQDQKAKFEQLAALAGLSDGRGESGKRKKKSDPDDPHVASCRIYDGDTPTSERAVIRRDPPRVLITNPDMLHLAILGHWTSWTPFLRDLKWIVLDELHAYRGIFGCHFHHVLSRLLRLAGRLGAQPSIVASSATAANAGGFASALTGRSFHWIEQSGAPREARSLLLFRPESSPYSTALDLFVACLEAGLKTIVFTKARRITELLYSWLKRRDRRLASRVASYRSGFLAPERRKIEADLFSGRLDGVVSTSALEMGIDVGGLDACILVGYPGSVMATWQRSGRVGRSGRRSLTALVAMPDALDQYFLDHPDELVSRPCERLVVDPGNAPIARQHLVCAAAEEPLLVDGADAAYLAPHAAVIDELVEEGRLLEAVDGPGLFSLERRPQRHVSIRGSGDTFAIASAANGRTIGTVDGVRVLHECHPGAVYLHRGRSWLVDELDLEKRRAVAERSDVDYYTTPLTDKETRILEVLEEKSDGPLHAWYGRVQVTERVIGYERRQIQGREVLSRHDLELPPLRFETTALWWAAPRAVEETMRRAGRHYMGGLHASEHATIALFPLLALCDRGDVGGISYPRHPQVGCGAVFVYDGHAGGAGIAAGGFTDLRRLLSRVAAMIDGCPCEEGCPSCIQSPKCGNGNRPLDKQAASETLHLLLGDDEPAVAWGEAPVLDLERGAGWAREGEGEERAEATEACEEAQVVEVATAAEPEAVTEPAIEPPAVEPIVLGRPPGRRRSNGAAAERPPGGGGGTVLFDLETLRSAADVGGWGRAYRMGVAVGVACFLEEGRFEVYREDRVGELVEALQTADLVVGFNVKRFDYQVLSGYTGVDYGRKLPTLDLLEEIHRRLGFRLGLGHLAVATLGVGKLADGLQSLEWVKEGRLDLVEDYCRGDVAILRDLYLHGRREGFVFYDDRKRGTRLKIPVDW